MGQGRTPRRYVSGIAKPLVCDLLGEISVDEPKAAPKVLTYNCVTNVYLSLDAFHSGNFMEQRAQDLLPKFFPKEEQSLRREDTPFAKHLAQTEGTM